MSPADREVWEITGEPNETDLRLAPLDRWHERQHKQLSLRYRLAVRPPAPIGSSLQTSAHRSTFRILHQSSSQADIRLL